MLMSLRCIIAALPLALTISINQMPINNNLNNFFYAIEGGETEEALLENSPNLNYTQTPVGESCNLGIGVEQQVNIARGFTPPSENEFALAAIAFFK